MELSDVIENLTSKSKSISLELEKDRKLDLFNEDLTNVIGKAIDSAANYVIKSIPAPDAIKDVLYDVKEAIKTRDLKTILTTTVKSTLREGLEMIGMSSKDIKTLTDFKDISLKGGLIQGIKNAIDIVANNFLKNNIVGNHVYTFFNKLKEYVLSNDFKQKISKKVNELVAKKDKFLEKCEAWYKAYNNMDLTSVNKISEELASNKYITRRYDDCARENSIIQNMTDMVNTKKTFLNQEQRVLCEVM